MLGIAVLYLHADIMTSFNPFAFRSWPVLFWTTVTYLAIFIPLVYIHENVPSVPNSKALPAGINLTDAWTDLQRITPYFHPYGSHANDDVRKYLIHRAKQILDANKAPYDVDKSGGHIWNPDSLALAAGVSLPGVSIADTAPSVTLFDDQISNATFVVEPTVKGSDTDSHSVQYFEGTNFYAYIRGKADLKGNWWTKPDVADELRGRGGVLVNCHYDSVSTSYGASDDGVGCVTLLQLLSHFTTSGQQPQHGIVLLFNNAEEDGLLGAAAFGYSPLRQFCHTFINLEGGGAGGRAMLFRATDMEIAKAYSSSPYPFGSVIGADAFESGVIQSGSDYQIFKDHHGMRGMDIAFYERRSHYHTEDDDTRRTSVKSVWHMLSAAIATTKTLSESTRFSGDRSDDRRDFVQNGKQVKGVYFDILGRFWIVFALRGLFIWTLTLLIVTPIVLAVVTMLLAKQDKNYFFARSTNSDSGSSDGRISLNGWRGLLGFPLALVFACGLTFGSILLVHKTNPLILYNSAYVVAAMCFSIAYSSFWFIARGCSYISPSALQRGYSLIWLYALVWVLQIFVAIAEDQFQTGSLYSIALLHTGVFIALLVSLVELFALSSKSNFAKQVQDANSRGTYSSINDDENTESERRESEVEEEEATETTPLRAREERYGGADGDVQTTFATTYRRTAPTDETTSKKSRKFSFNGSEQPWSDRLPSWTWFLQLLVLAPMHLIITGGIALAGITSVAQTSVDGSDTLTPFLLVGILTMILLLPLTPFIHRIGHHLPTFLLFLFAGTFVYNLVAFPFSASHRFKYLFHQTIDIDNSTNQVSVDGINDYIHEIIKSLPSTAGQSIACTTDERKLSECAYDGSSLPPDLVTGYQTKDLVHLKASRSADGQSISVLLDAVETRTCTLFFSPPVASVLIENSAPIEKEPTGGISSLLLWRRTWQGSWNVTLKLENESSDKAKSEDKALKITASCGWSDANVATNIPALTELKRYAPQWSVALEFDSSGLVQVKKTVKV